MNNIDNAIFFDRDQRKMGSEHEAKFTTPRKVAAMSGDEGHSTSQGSTNSIRTSGHSHSGSTATSTSAMTFSDSSNSHRGSVGGLESLSFSFNDNASPLQEIKNRMPEDYSKMRKRISGGEVTTLNKEKISRRRNMTRRDASNSTACSQVDYDETFNHDLAFPKSNTRERISEMQARIPSDPCDKSTKDAEMTPSIDQVARRNSLGDLKIPSRISKAQENIRNNISRVKEFAQGIEDLKTLQQLYREKMAKKNITDRKRMEIEEEYGNWWECAEVLIDLGRGKGGEEEDIDVGSLERGKSAMDIYSQSPSKVTKMQNRLSMDLVKSVQREGDLRSPSSRASSSSRSIDPQREAEILSAMLSGAPINLISPSRPTTPFQEREMSITEHNSPSGMEITSKKEAIDDKKDESPPVRSNQRKSQERRKNSSIITTANKPAIYYSHSQLTSPLVPRPKIYQHSLTSATGDDATLAPAWTASTDSISTQGTTNRRARLRSAGKVGLQGLKELLRTLKINSAVSQSSMDLPSQAKSSLVRIATNDSRVTLDHLELAVDSQKGVDTSTHLQLDDEMGEEEEASSSRFMNLIRSHTIFGKSKRQSKECQRDSIDEKDYAKLQDQSSLQSKKPMRGKSAIVNGRFARASSSAKEYNADSSMDSDWTEADFGSASCIETGTHSDLMKTPNAGKKKFTLFTQRSISASIVEKYNSQKVSFAGDTSTEDEDFAAFRRQSLQIPFSSKGEEKRASKGARSRTISNTKQKIHLDNDKVKGISLKSEGDLANSFESSLDDFYTGRKATNRPSMASTMISTSGTESTTSSSGTQTESKASRRASSRLDHTLIAGNRKRASSTSSTPPRAIRSIQAGKYKKLILQADAIPSLLVYVEATKERCQECIELLHLEVPTVLL